MKQIVTILLIALMAMTLTSCDRSQANVQTLISNDCGVTWELIKPGQVIPSRVGPCAL